ncbi:MAG: DUF5618 family protein [Bacteroidia bacterium]|nr:DUF5618 family protein [Bacteroidia bacterium]
MNALKKIEETERYLNNAREILKKAGRENGYYKDSKYVSIACGAAYKAAELAASAYLSKKGMEIIKKKGSRKNVDDYRKALATQNRKVLNSFNVCYNVLHLDGYYDGILKVKTIESGFEALQELIDFTK